MVLAGFEHAVLDFLDRYGYVAYFLVLGLETGFILHFVPGELIVSVATARLANSPLSLVAVIAVGTLAATAGSVLLYVIVRYGGRAWIEKHSHRHTWIAKMQRTFERPSGEALVFVFRFLPIVRAPITIPAAIAKMEPAKFVAYSAAGNLVFVGGIAYLTYVAKGSDAIRELLARASAYVGANIVILALSAAGAALLAWWIWSERKALVAEPDHVVARAWRGAALLALATGVVLLGFAVIFPGRARGLVALVFEDYGSWAATHGLSDLITVGIVALQLVGLGLVALALTRAVRSAASKLRRSREGAP